MRRGMPAFRGRIFRAMLRSVLLIMGLGSLSAAVEARASGYDLGIIEPAVLHRAMGDWAILDGRPRAEWSKGHLPGARSFSWEDYTRTDAEGVPYRVRYPHELARALESMGIDEKAPVVVYGDADTSWGGEGWAAWALTWIGHQGPIRLLDGGIRAWESAALPLEGGEVSESGSPATYRLSVRPEVNVATADLRRQLDGVALIDTRSGWEWLKGHLPHAVHLPWKDLLAGEDNRPLSPRQYKALLADKGIPTDRPVVFYCTGGIRSGYAWLIHQLSGAGQASNYEGGTEAWERLSER